MPLRRKRSTPIADPKQDDGQADDDAFLEVMRIVDSGGSEPEKRRRRRALGWPFRARTGTPIETSRDPVAGPPPASAAAALRETGTPLEATAELIVVGSGETGTVPVAPTLARFASGAGEVRGARLQACMRIGTTVHLLRHLPGPAAAPAGDGVVRQAAPLVASQPRPSAEAVAGDPRLAARAHKREVRGVRFGPYIRIGTTEHSIRRSVFAQRSPAG